jgi:transposase
MPVVVKFSAAALHDQQFYQYIHVLPLGSIIAFDKAYINYAQFEAFNQKEITYVVPQKENASYQSIKELNLLDEEPNILKDEIIEVKYKDIIEGIEINKTLQLRRIAYYSEKHQTTFIYWTNNLELTATQVVTIYASRWQIEVFFKKLKQNFPLDYFLGDNENAIEIQIWCSLIALILLQVLHKENDATISFSILNSIVRLHLMNYIGLASIINQYKQKRTRIKKEPPKKRHKINRHPQISQQKLF